MLLLEYYSQGSLWRFIRSHRREIDLDIWTRWFLQLASALLRLEQVGIVHHDIKPHNIMVDKDMNLHLSDFGTASFVSADSPLVDGTGKGTAPYSAPELVYTPSSSYSFPVDIFSTAVTMYVAGFTAEEPYRGIRNSVELLLRVRRGQFLEYEEKIAFEDVSSSESLSEGMYTWSERPSIGPTEMTEPSFESEMDERENEERMLHALGVPHGCDDMHLTAGMDVQLDTRVIYLYEKIALLAWDVCASLLLMNQLHRVVVATMPCPSLFAM